MTRLNVELFPRKSRGVPKPWVVVKRRVDPVMTELRARRLELGLTQDDLADRIGISAFTVGRGEQGKVSPTLRTLRDWAKALGMKLTLEDAE